MDFVAFIPIVNTIVQLIGRIAERLGVEKADQATRAFAAVLQHSGASARQLVAFRNRLARLEKDGQIDQAKLRALMEELQQESDELDDQLAANKAAIEARLDQEASDAE